MMRGLGTGGVESGVAAIDIPLTGNLIGVSWSVSAILNVTEEIMVAELAFSSSANFVNDARNVISMVLLQAGVLSGVGAVVEFENYHHVMEIGVSQGERLFLHASASSGVTSVIYAVLTFDFDLDRPLARRR